MCDLEGFQPYAELLESKIHDADAYYSERSAIANVINRSPARVEEMFQIFKAVMRKTGTIKGKHFHGK